MKSRYGGRVCGCRRPSGHITLAGGRSVPGGPLTSGRFEKLLRAQIPKRGVNVTGTTGPFSGCASNVPLF